MNHRCIKCGYDFMYGSSDRHTAPVTTTGIPVCPVCWDKFLDTIGLGYCTAVFHKIGSDYEVQMKVKEMA